ncbi:MAG: acyl-CoA dehydrogenase, partial [Nocardioidaceae bacterium]|nr:acyl-CoA dehydrogenase [Nocardioidaceae bacterium]
APRKQAGISFLLIDMASPGVTVRPIRLIDGGSLVNEVFFEDVRVPVGNLVGQENHGWDYAKFLLGNERVGIAGVGGTKWLLAEAKTWAGDRLREDPLLAADFARLENDLLAVELTSIRVAAGSADGKAQPASSVLKLAGSELQQAVTELVLNLAGEQGLSSSPVAGAPAWTRAAAPNYLHLRAASIYGGSNEVQRQIIAGTILGL